MFFYASKLLWFVVEPLNLMLILVFIAFVSLCRGKNILAKRLLLAVVCTSVILLVFPVGEAMVVALEQRFPATPLPERVDGIILLGGAQRPLITQQFKQPAMNGAAETMTMFLALARRYPGAKLVFAGGSGDIRNQDVSEAGTVRLFLQQQGFDPTKVSYESQSRNTAENVAFAKRLAQPKAGQNWLVITTAVGVPRVVGTFRHAGWPVSPVACSYSVLPRLHFFTSLSFNDAYSRFSQGLHEWIGLIAYYIAGKTSEWFPHP